MKYGYVERRDRSIFAFGHVPCQDNFGLWRMDLWNFICRDLCGNGFGGHAVFARRFIVVRGWHICRFGFVEYWLSCFADDRRCHSWRFG